MTRTFFVYTYGKFRPSTPPPMRGTHLSKIHGSGAQRNQSPVARDPNNQGATTQTCNDQLLILKGFLNTVLAEGP